MDLRSRPLSAAVLLAVAATLAACGGGTQDDNGGPPSPTATPLPVASGASGTLNLFVSNQSFRDDTVGIVVRVDGKTVVDQDFEVGSQHNWASFPLVLPAGTRTVDAVADTGIRMRGTVTVPAGGTHWAVVDYWDYEDEPKKLSFHESAEPIAFA